MQKAALVNNFLILGAVHKSGHLKKFLKIIKLRASKRKQALHRKPSLINKFIPCQSWARFSISLAWICFSFTRGFSFQILFSLQRYLIRDWIKMKSIIAMELWIARERKQTKAYFNYNFDDKDGDGGLRVKSWQFQLIILSCFYWICRKANNCANEALNVSWMWK